ncbi:MAG TPA: hypothetical protein VLH38_03955 [Patescibacteria group bacterium]|nr:hypothetical protein [Patescibacteria group bacterium]
MVEGEQQPSQDQEKGTWQYKPEGSTPVAFDVSTDSSARPKPVDDVVEWTASEFIAHPKNPTWYVALAVVMIVLSAGIYFITHSLVAMLAIAIMGLVLGVAASRQPRIVGYRLDRGGLSIEKHFHPYGNFKSYAIIDEGAFSSITLVPLRRFDLPLNIYFSPEDEHKIIGAISKYLPAERGELDALAHFMRTIHF